MKSYWSAAYLSLTTERVRDQFETYRDDSKPSEYWTYRAYAVENTSIVVFSRQNTDYLERAKCKLCDKRFYAPMDDKHRKNTGVIEWVLEHSKYHTSEPTPQTTAPMAAALLERIEKLEKRCDKLENIREDLLKVLNA